MSTNGGTMSFLDYGHDQVHDLLAKSEWVRCL